MRRILTTLMILLVVLVAGLSALVMLVNPNDFRAYMVRQVAERSGYQLKLDGPLRWHVWPQLSIISGRMTLTAPGASQPLIVADNMRLDVSLLPLLSHQLQVKQVMLKGSVIQLTPQTEAVRENDAPVAPKENTLPQVAEDRGWSFDIAGLQVADSVLVFQHDSDEQVTVRNIRLKMQQNKQHQADVDFSGNITRNQRELALSLKAQVDAGDYPHLLTATINQLDWQLQGADLPAQGIGGQASLHAQWQEEQKKIAFSQLNLTASDSVLKGEGSVVLADRPQWSLNLQFDKLNLDNLLLRDDSAAGTSVSQQGQSQKSQPRPVIAADGDVADYRDLAGFDAQLVLKAKQLQWRGMPFSQVSTQVTNQGGLLKFNELQGNLGSGHISLPGSLDARTANPVAMFRPQLENIEIGTILKAFDYPIALTGKTNLSGEFSGHKVDAQAFREDWQGEAQIRIADVRSEGLNFQQLVQQAVERSTNVRAQESYENATRLDLLTSNMSLKNGKVTLENISGSSPLLALDGKGALDLARQQGDMLFNVRVLDGWKGDAELIAMLKNTAIPLRVYGKWQALNYSLQLDQTLRKYLQDEAKRRINDWVERNKDSRDAQDVKKLMDKK